MLTLALVLSATTPRAGIPGAGPGEAEWATADEVARLRRLFGERIWPETALLDIPLILYNDRSEFLFGAVGVHPPWTVVPGRDWQGHPVFRRDADQPQAFAVQLGGQWVASCPSRSRFEQKIPFRFGSGYHTCLCLHEVFHAVQARLAPNRFARALAVYRYEKAYGEAQDRFRETWNHEGECLARALKAATDDDSRAQVCRFVELRRDRHRQAALSPEVAAFELQMEWLEGLAKYAEIRFYDLALERAGEPGFEAYRERAFVRDVDFWRLETALGSQEGDLRFYLSGMAQALLLDRLRPDWKRTSTLEKLDFDALLGEIADSD